MELVLLLTAPAVLAVILWASFGNFRRLLLPSRRPTVLPVAETDQGDGVVHVLLIHGTFARNAAWTLCGSRVCKSVVSTIPTAAISRLVWSGDNHHGVRIEAARRAIDWISHLPQTSRVVLIGHSHGGSIAALIASRLRHDSRISVVAMACPVIVARPRYAGLAIIPKQKWRAHTYDHERYSYGGLFLVLCTIQAIAASIVFNESFFASLGALATFWAALIIMFRLSDTSEIQRLKDMAEQYCKEQEVTGCVDRTLLIRTPGDEASGLLALGHLGAWSVRHAFAAMYRIGSFFRTIERFIQEETGGLPSFAWLCTFFGLGFAIRVLGPLGLVIFFLFSLVALLRFGLVSALIEGSLHCALLPLTFAAHLPFGMDVARLGSLLAISVESTPIGKWNLQVLEPDPNAPISHSVVYDSDQAMDSISAWLSETLSPTIPIATDNEEPSENRTLGVAH